MTAPAGLVVTVWTGEYEPITEVGAYTEVQVEHARMAVGPGTLVLEEGDDPLAVAAIQACNTAVVPVTVDDGVKRWTGRVAHCETDGTPGQSVVTATLIDDFSWAKHVQCWPSPTAPLASPATTSYANPSVPLNADPNGHYVRRGPVVTVVKECIQANAVTRLNLPHAVVPAAGPDTSPQVELRTRFGTFEEALVPLCRATGHNLTVTLWLPGDDQPAGLYLTAPTIVWDVTAAPAPDWLKWSDEVGIVDRQIAVTHPTAVTGTLLGPAYRLQPTSPWQSTDNDAPELPQAQLIGQVTDTALAAQLGGFAFPEAALSTDGGDTADLSDATTDANNAGAGTPGSLAAWQAAVTAALAALPDTGRVDLAELGGTAGLVMTVDEDPYQLGRDYDVGTKAVGLTGGNAVVEYVEKVVVTDNRADGLTYRPQLGDGSLTESTDVVLVQDMAELRTQLARIARGSR